MARIVGVFFFCAAALGHGESNRTGGPGAVPVIVIRTGRTLGPGRTASGRDPAPPQTEVDRPKLHTWEVWWSYHREYYLALRSRGAVITRPRASEDALQRKAPLRERILGILLQAIADKDHDVRAAAAIALGKCGAATAVRGALETRLHDAPEASPDVRESLLYGTGLLGVPGNRILLDSVARDEGRAPKERSLALMGLMVDGTKESADLLVAHARWLGPGVMADPEESPSRAEQDRCRFALHLLGFVDLPGYDDFLSEVVGGGGQWEGGEQGLAVTALGRRRARDRKEQLFGLLDPKGYDRSVKRAVPIALGMMLEPGDTKDLERLARFIRDSRADPVAQHFAVMALGQVGGETAVELLGGLLSGLVFGDEEDRAFVHLALGLCGTRSAKAREILLAQYRGVRAEAEASALALACGLSKVQEAVPITIGSMDRPHFRETRRAGTRGRFRGAAALGLGFHGDPRGVDAVRSALARPGGLTVREQAAIALALLEGEKAVPELVGILEKADTARGKASAVEALAVLPDPSPDVVDALARVYRSKATPDPVRAMATSALGTLADPRPVPMSALLVRSYNYYIACLALDEIASYL